MTDESTHDPTDDTTGHATDSPTDDPADDGYDGPAEVLKGDAVTPVQVRLSGHFDPISGSYRWYGRVAAAPEVTALGTRPVALRTPPATVATVLKDVDPWGRPRVEGFGSPPFAVLDHVRD